jgi:hypothetical protein
MSEIPRQNTLELSIYILTNEKYEAKIGPV